MDSYISHDAGSVAERILNTIPMACYELDHEARFIYINQKALNFFGRTKEEMVGKSVWELFPSVEQTRGYTLIINAIHHKQESVAEYLSAITHTPISLTATPTDNGVIISFTEIDAKAKAEKELEDSKALLDAVTHISPLGMVVLKSIRNLKQQIIDFEYISLNPVSQAMAGADIAGQRMLDLYPHIKKNGLFDAYINAVEQNMPVDFEEYYMPKQRWFRWMAAKLNDGLFISVEEITQRKQAEQQMLEDAALIQGMADAAPDMLYIIDITDMCNVYANTNMQRLFQKTSEEIKAMGTGFFDAIICSEDRKHYYKNIAEMRLAADSEIKELMYRLLDGEGCLHWIKTRRTVYKRNAQGEATHIIGISQDITEQVALQERNRQLREERNEMEERQRQEIFRVTLSTQEEERKRIAENLHNSLGQILYGVKLSLNHFNPDKPERSAENQAAYQQINQLLLTAIKETRQISYQLMPAILEDFGLQSAIRDICAQFNTSVKLKCEFAGFTQKLDTYLDIAIYRIVQELLTNIIKHAEATEGLLRIKISAAYITITIKDNGKGFDATSLQVKGIGLKTTRNKIKLLNGEMHISSVQSKGTTINISIPKQSLH